MNLSDVMTYVRLGITAAITILGILATSYPHEMWIPATIGVLATVSAHIVPSVQQSKTQ